MLDHIGLTVSDFARSKAFYEAALLPLGITVQMSFEGPQSAEYQGVGFGTPGKPGFWLSKTPDSATRPLHVAFSAADRPTVDAFYAAAMAAGGRDNGPPGLRPDYHPDYYAAFVLDPDGVNVEAVCHKPA